MEIEFDLNADGALVVEVWGVHKRGPRDSRPLKQLKPVELKYWVSGYNGMTALHYAARKTSTKPLRFCLENGCDALVNTLNNLGEPPLSLVRSGEHLRLLLEAGANPNILETSGRSCAMSYIVWRGNATDFEMLVSAGMHEDRFKNGLLRRNPLSWTWSAAALVDQGSGGSFVRWWPDYEKWPWHTEDEVHEIRWRVYFRESLVWQLLIGLARLSSPPPVKRFQ